MTSTTRLPFVFLATLGTLACDMGGETASAGDPAAETAASEAPVPETPGLPSVSTEFQPSPTADGVDGLTGELWIATSQAGGPDGISLIAQLENVPVGQAYSWAVHSADCTSPDQPVLPLGFGTEATGNRERAAQGGPLGEPRAAFQPTDAGHVEETVWIPFDGALDRDRFEAGPYSLRIHPSAGAGELRPSVACARIPVVRER